MVVKVKEKYEKTRHVKNNVRYHERILSKKRNFIISLESIVRIKILQKLHWPTF